MKSHLFNWLSLVVAFVLMVPTSLPAVAAQLPPPDPILPNEATAPPSRPASTSTEPSAHPSRAHLEQGFGQLPLYFVENQGQLDERVAYYIQGSDKTLYFTAEGVTFALTDSQPTTTTHQAPMGDPSMPTFARADSASETQRWVVKLDFVGANPDVRPIGQEKTEAILSYFKGSPDEWHAGLPTYSRIVYRDLWPGIDLVYYGTVNQLKYEFVVHPGADPDQIRLAYRGATDVALNAAGQLTGGDHTRRQLC